MGLITDILQGGKEVEGGRVVVIVVWKRGRKVDRKNYKVFNFPSCEIVRRRKMLLATMVHSNCAAVPQYRVTSTHEYGTQSGSPNCNSTLRLRGKKERRGLYTLDL
jgi:hypothetical protein